MENSLQQQADTTVEKSRKQRIEMPEMAVLLFFATIFDIFSLIPIVNDVIVLVGQGLMALFFLLMGVSVFSGPKRCAAYLITIIVEAIPAISMFPTFILETIIIIAITRTEDKSGVNISSVVYGKFPIPRV